MDLSVIIVSYRTRSRLEECLAALDAAEGPSREIIVVDNASGDGSAELVRARQPSATLLVNPYNYGFAIANNQGFALARGRYVMTLNPDAIVSERTLSELVGFLDRTPEAGLASPAFLGSDGSREPMSCSLKPIETPHLWRMLRPLPPMQADEPFPVPWIWGTGYACRRAALGGRFFDEECFLFGEEYALARRLHAGGHRLYVVPAATLRHSVSASYSRQQQALSRARRLGTAVVWRMRKREFGAFVAGLSQSVVLADSALLWLALCLTGLRRDALAGERSLGRADFGARVAASMGVLVCGERYLRRMDEACWRHFNGGARPPLPPVPARRDEAALS